MSEDRKLVIVKVNGDADIRETWEFSVPATWQAPDDEDVLDALNSDDNANFVGVDTEVENENNRVIESIEICELAPPTTVDVPSNEHTLAFLSEKLDAALEDLRHGKGDPLAAIAEVSFELTTKHLNSGA